MTAIWWPSTSLERHRSRRTSSRYNNPEVELVNDHDSENTRPFRAVFCSSQSRGSVGEVQLTDTRGLLLDFHQRNTFPIRSSRFLSVRILLTVEMTRSFSKDSFDHRHPALPAVIRSILVSWHCTND